MEKKLKILLLEDTRTDAALIKRLLDKSDLQFEFKHVLNKKDYLAALENFFPDLVLSDNSLSGFNATEALQLTRQRSAHIPFILVTGTVSEEFAATIMKLGADDYILKDRMVRLPVAIDAALKQRRLEQEKQDAADKLISSEQKYRTLFLKSPLPKWIFDVDTLQFLEVNETAVKLYGYSPEEFYAMTIKDIRPKEEVELLMADLKQLQGDEDLRHGNWKHRKKNGELMIVETTAHSIEYNDRKARMVVVIDVTEKIKAAEAIAKSEEKYRTLVDQAFDAIIVYSVTGFILDCNHTACDYIGYTKKELKGLTITQLFFKEDLLEKPLDLQALKSGQPAFDYRKIKRKDGTHIDMEISSKMLPDGNLMAIARDITEKKKAQEQILKTQVRLKQAQEIAHLGNWHIDFKTNTSQWSDEAYRIYGIEPGDHNISQEDWISFIHPDDIGRVKEIVAASAVTFSDINFQHRIVRPDKTIRHIQSESKFEFDKKGNPAGLYGVALDITAIKTAEEERNKLEHQLFEQQRKEQLKITATALEAQEKERTAIGQELHDNVNQILAATKMNLKIATGATTGINSIITTSIDYIDQAIVENRKIAHALVTPDLELGSLLEQLKGLVKSMLGTAGLKTHFSTRSFKEEKLDKSRKIAIYRIAQEQCTNIIKYAAANAAVVSLSTTSSSFKMVIEDDGKGMEKGKKIEGIGLRNINSRLSVFNGSAQIITAPGKGFRLEIEIPLTEHPL